MMTPEQLLELEQVIATPTPRESKDAEGELAKLTAIADAIDCKLRIPPDHNQSVSSRINSQFRGLLAALANEKKTQTQAEGKGL